MAARANRKLRGRHFAALGLWRAVHVPHRLAGQDLGFDYASDGAVSDTELGDTATAESVQAFYAAETSLANAAITGANLDSSSKALYLGTQTTLRWLLTHMIEETARHAGHLDITRELIDGKIGR